MIFPRSAPFIAVAAVLASSVLPGRSSVLVNSGNQPPSQDVVISQIVPDDDAMGYQWRNTETDGRRDLGQLFKPDTNLTLRQITVQLQVGSGAGAKKAPFTIAIFELRSALPVAISRTIANVQGVMPERGLPANSFLTFDLSSEKLELKSGTTYAFLLSFEDPAAARGLSLQSQIVTPTELSRRIESPDGTSLKSSKMSLEFYIQAIPR